MGPWTLLKRPNLLYKFTKMPLQPLLTISSSITDSLKNSGIFGEVLPEFKPLGLLQVHYPPNNEVSLGNTLAVDETQSKPQFQFILNPPSGKGGATDQEAAFKPTDKFTLVLTDPDAPSREDKKWSEYAHYIHTGLTFPAAAQEAGFFTAELDPAESGKEVLSYVGPGPPQGTGKHRYVFLLFKETGDKFTEVKDRPNWGYGTPATGVEKWATENSLVPVAANFFLAENK